MILDHPCDFVLFIGQFSREESNTIDTKNQLYHILKVKTQKGKRYGKCHMRTNAQMCIHTCISSCSNQILIFSALESKIFLKYIDHVQEYLIYTIQDLEAKQ